MLIERNADWDAALYAYLTASEGLAYAYGKADCALFAAGAVEAMTGVDPAKPFRGRYSTARGSARALRRYGAGDLGNTLDGLFPAIPASMARRGDLAWHDNAVGVVIGSDALFMADTGQVRVPRAEWAKAWRV